MKKNMFIIRIVAFTVLIALTFTQCSEVPIEINTDKGPSETFEFEINADVDTRELMLQPRIPFIEEFTGVACVQCPEGSEFLEDLLDIHQEKLVAVSIHGGFFSRLFTESVRDLKVDDGVALINLFSEPEGYPAAIINRKQFPGNQSFHVFREDWAGFIIDEQQGDPSIAINLEASMTEEGNQLYIKVQILPIANIPDNLRLTVGIAESGIVEAQKTPEGTVVDYVHKHVLRDIITEFNGAVLQNLVEGQVTEGEVVVDLPDDLVVENAEIFAAVHTLNPTLEVLQANKTKITQ